MLPCMSIRGERNRQLTQHAADQTQRQPGSMHRISNAFLRHLGDTVVHPFMQCGCGM